MRVQLAGLACGVLAATGGFAPVSAAEEFRPYPTAGYAVNNLVDTKTGGRVVADFLFPPFAEGKGRLHFTIYFDCHGPQGRKSGRDEFFVTNSGNEVQIQNAAGQPKDKVSDLMSISVPAYTHLGVDKEGELYDEHLKLTANILKLNTTCRTTTVMDPL